MLFADSSTEFIQNDTKSYLIYIKPDKGTYYHANTNINSDTHEGRTKFIEAELRINIE